jgi:hypothetical protein
MFQGSRLARPGDKREPYPLAALSDGESPEGAMSEKRQYTTVRVSFRKYSSNDNNQERDGYRHLFLMCIAKRTPSVLDELATCVFPAYSRAFWSEAASRGPEAVWFDNGTMLHDQVVPVWLNQQTGSDLWNWYDAVREPLMTWCTRYQIKTGWILKIVLDTLAQWSRDRKAFSRFEKIPANISAAAASGNQSAIEWKRKLEAAKQQPIMWPTLPTTYSALDTLGEQKRTFEYPEWEGYDKALYELAVRSAFEKHLKDHLAEIQSRIGGMDRISSSKLEYFEMLALYYCGNLSPEQLSEKLGEVWYGSEPSVIFRHIKTATKLVGGLAPKPAGKRPKR